MVPQQAERNLEPRDLVVAAWTLGKGAFVEQVGAPLLLFKIDDAAGELAATLREITTRGGAPLAPTIGFETVSELNDSGPPRSAFPLTFGAPQVVVRLVRALHFAVPLRKRPEAGKGFIERISVGRARNNDIVVRHESVSKFHAWFRRDEDDVWYAGDAPSRNGTRVNGAALAGGKPARLGAGDVVCFGSVEALVCPAELLWEAIRLP
jgi:hypothetical protein